MKIAVKLEDKDMKKMAVELLPLFPCVYWIKSRYTLVMIFFKLPEQGVHLKH
jgi:hypothetical protein